MTATHDTISQWLTTIPKTCVLDTNQTSATHNRKRRHIPSPDMSEDDSELYSTPLKKHQPDPDATPRNSHAPTPMPLEDGTASSISWSSNASSSRLKRSRSGRSSPTKGLAFLRMEHIIGHKSFGERDLLPPSLKRMAQGVRNDAAGVGIFSAADRDRISSYMAANSLFEGLLDAPHLFNESGQREELGALPDLDTLVHIWEEAQMCEVEGHSEAMWNCAVHYPLLCSTLRKAKVNQAEAHSEIQVRPMNM